MKQLCSRRVFVICCMVIMAACIGSGAMKTKVAQAKVVDKGKCGIDVSWQLYSNGTLKIKGDGDMELGANYWKTDKKYIKKVVIKKGVTSVAPFAFQLCENVTSVTLPKGLDTIGTRAFDHCIRLKSVTMSKGLTTIEARAFGGCSRLKKLTIPASVLNIGDEVVQDCSSLTDVYIKGTNTTLSVKSFAQQGGRKRTLYLHGGLNVRKYVDSIALSDLKYKK